jgi:hypothetical protein
MLLCTFSHISYSHSTLISRKKCATINWMTAYTIPRAHTLSLDVAERRAARRKVIERAQQLERESYKALMKKKRQLHERMRTAIVHGR